MPEIQVKDLTGQQVDTLELSDRVFGAPVNVPLMHQAVTRILADQRLGTQKAKTRGQVSGSTVKPWRQKGTGRARQGSRKSPVWRGGGVVFAPAPRSYTVSMPKKMRRAATRSALSSQLAAGNIVVVSTLQPAEPKTKIMLTSLQNLNANRKKVMLVDEQVTDETKRASRNIPGVETKPASTLNIVDVLNHDVLVMSVSGIRYLERLLSDASV